MRHRKLPRYPSWHKLNYQDYPLPSVRLRALQIDQLHKKGIVKPGDLLYWDFLGDGHIGHATLITDVNGSIKYSGHTRDTYNSDLRKEYELTTQVVREQLPEAQPKLRIVRMKNRIPSKPVDYEQ